MKIAVSTGNSRMDKKWNLTEMEFEDFRERISKTQRTAETMEQYRKMKKSQQDDIKDVGGFAFAAGRLSPVREDSSVLRSLLSNNLASATSLSPVSTKRISPTTMSFCGISWGELFLNAFTSVSSLMRFNASKALALFPSVTIVITTDNAIAAKIPAHSRKLYSPPVI